MSKNNKGNNSFEKFKKNKIEKLNSFFMRKIIISTVITILMFLISVALLILIINIKDIDSGLKITLISVTASFILTTAKTLIDKSIQIISYLVILLSEEQRGINENLGINVDKVDFESVVSEVDLEE